MNDIKTNIIKTIDYKFNNDMLHNDMSNTDKTNNSSLSPKPDLSSLPTGKIKYGLVQGSISGEQKSSRGTALRSADTSRGKHSSHRYRKSY